MVSHPRAGRTLRVHPVCLLQHQLSQLLVERGQVLGSCGTDAGKDGSHLSRGTPHLRAVQIFASTGGIVVCSPDPGPKFLS